MVMDNLKSENMALRETIVLSTIYQVRLTNEYRLGSVTSKLN